MATSHITQFIQSLNFEEIKIVKEYVYKSNTSKDNKISQLFKIVTENNDRKIDDLELIKLLKSNAGAIRVLKSRLFEKVKDALIQNKHFENPQIFNEREKIVFQLKREVLFAKSISRILDHNRFETLNLLLNEIIATGEYHQTYDILVEALSIQKHFIGFRNGFLTLEKIRNKIRFYEKCYSAVQNANDIFYDLTMNPEFAPL